MYLLSRFMLILAVTLLFVFTVPAAVFAVQETIPQHQGLVWAILIGSTTKIFFGCTSLQEAEFLSKSLGSETILVEGGGHSSN